MTVFVLMASMSDATEEVTDNFQPTIGRKGDHRIGEQAVYAGSELRDFSERLAFLRLEEAKRGRFAY